MGHNRGMNHSHFGQCLKGAFIWAIASSIVVTVTLAIAQSAQPQEVIFRSALIALVSTVCFSFYILFKAADVKKIGDVLGLFLTLLVLSIAPCAMAVSLPQLGGGLLLNHGDAVITGVMGVIVSLFFYTKIYQWSKQKEREETAAA